MTTKEAEERCRNSAYELSKAIGKVCEIRDRIEYVAEEMGWDTMLVGDFDDAMVKLTKVMSGMTLWALEGEFRDEEIVSLREQADALEKSE